jgi:GxxExxY protein
MSNVRRKDLVLPELSYEVVGCCIDAYHAVGGGRKELVYQRAVAIQLARRNLSFREQCSVRIACEGHVVGADILDFFIENSLVLELKAGVRFRRQDYAQVRRYLVSKDAPLGLLVRFSMNGVVWERVLSPHAQTESKHHSSTIS